MRKLQTNVIRNALSEFRQFWRRESEGRLTRPSTARASTTKRFARLVSCYRVHFCFAGGIVAAAAGLFKQRDVPWFEVKLGPRTAAGLLLLVPCTCSGFALLWLAMTSSKQKRTTSQEPEQANGYQGVPWHGLGLSADSMRLSSWRVEECCLSLLLGTNMHFGPFLLGRKACGGGMGWALLMCN